VARHPIPNSNFPISQSVEVKGNVTTYYLSGQCRRSEVPASQAAISSQGLQIEKRHWES